MPIDTAEITKNVSEYTDAKKDGMNSRGLTWQEIFAKGENTGRERSEVNSLLNPTVMNDSNARAAINADLQAKGLLPDLLLSEFDNLDTNKDGKISSTEAQAVQDDYQHKDGVTVIAADAALGSASAIDINGDGITRDEIVAYKAAHPGAPETTAETTATTAPEAGAEPAAEPISVPVAEATPEGSTEQLPVTPENQRDPRLLVLEDPSKTMEEKLQAARDYARDNGGNTEVDLTQPDGTTIRVRIEVSAIGGNGREYVHLYVKKEGGGETIALRGISDSEGTISSEKKRDGTDAGLVGDKWGTDHKGVFLG